MQVTVLFFGATADETGERSMNLAVDQSNSRVGNTLNTILEKFPQLGRHKLRIAVNQEYVSFDQVLKDGDELAIFTAVSGG